MGGRTVRGGSRTLRARLAEYEQTGEPVTLHTSEGEVRGRIAVAATDHVVVDDDDMEHVVPAGT
ncbi:MAG: hypothetical protein GWN79_28635, partial [Actinobacteria bacterium]|nr:hypothetical protein [Actinomycetota bacterium]NIS37234.1 hypothetical protein [Actinomycetota bacterium]NIT99153.1 hypothetical protein [Actinomycetota bacterium]NIU22763.1 hypothetical protein [Actinomycetota bacterium]NIU71665.1 hypothetical protein [Actinomycetota bacterium]